MRGRGRSLSSIEMSVPGFERCSVVPEPLKITQHQRNPKLTQSASEPSIHHQHASGACHVPRLCWSFCRRGAQHNVHVRARIDGLVLMLGFWKATGVGKPVHTQKVPAAKARNSHQDHHLPPDRCRRQHSPLALVSWSSYGHTFGTCALTLSDKAVSANRALAFVARSSCAWVLHALKTIYAARPLLGAVSRVIS